MRSSALAVRGGPSDVASARIVVSRLMTRPLSGAVLVVVPLLLLED